MFRLPLLISILLALILVPAGIAQDDAKPTIAFLRYAGTAPVTEATNGILDSLQAYGYLTAAERAALNESYDLIGENVNLLYRDAGFDLPSVNLMVEEVLDKGADAIVTITTQVAQIAVNATRDMDDPPAILFSLVTTPYTTGIADASCIKPAHVAGTQPLLSFAAYVPLVMIQNPDIQAIGTIESPDQPTSVLGSRLITQLGESLGLTVEVASAVQLADLNVAVESLLGKGVEAIVLSINPLTLQGTPVLVQLTAEYGIPLYAPVIQQVYRGATIAAGFYSFYDEGVIAARLLHAYLSGEVDLADIAINQSSSFGVAINLDTAAEQGIEISEALLARANFVIEDGQRAAGAASDLGDPDAARAMTMEERLAADKEFLAALACTPEIIAEQQAALDAADG
ncbi:MAG: ABC transporter substrate binding protein [Chloroflexota bacterium]|nr:ABC transporter substrate binding protein [Chloroflexota bacterium]